MVSIYSLYLIPTKRNINYRFKTYMLTSCLGIGDYTFSKYKSSSISWRFLTYTKIEFIFTVSRIYNFMFLHKSMLGIRWINPTNAMKTTPRYSWEFCCKRKNKVNPKRKMQLVFLNVILLQ